MNLLRSYCNYMQMWLRFKKCNPTQITESQGIYPFVGMNMLSKFHGNLIIWLYESWVKQPINVFSKCHHNLSFRCLYCMCVTKQDKKVECNCCCSDILLNRNINFSQYLQELPLSGRLLIRSVTDGNLTPSFFYGGHFEMSQQKTHRCI